MIMFRHLRNEGSNVRWAGLRSWDANCMPRVHPPVRAVPSQRVAHHFTFPVIEQVNDCSSSFRTLSQRRRRRVAAAPARSERSAPALPCYTCRAAQQPTETASIGDGEMPSCPVLAAGDFTCTIKWASRLVQSTH